MCQIRSLHACQKYWTAIVQNRKWKESFSGPMEDTPLPKNIIWKYYLQLVFTCLNFATWRFRFCFLMLQSKPKHNEVCHCVIASVVRSTVLADGAWPGSGVCGRTQETLKTNALHSYVDSMGYTHTDRKFTASFQISSLIRKRIKQNTPAQRNVQVNLQTGYDNTFSQSLLYNIVLSLISVSACSHMSGISPHW